LVHETRRHGHTKTQTFESVLNLVLWSLSDQQEENQALDLLGEAERLRRKAWELLGKMESERDHRGSVVGLREVRQCLETLGEMLSLAPNGIDLAAIPDDVLQAEAQRRNLKSEVVLRVVYDRVELSAPSSGVL
jgi:hypothetical protein